MTLPPCATCGSSLAHKVIFNQFLTLMFCRQCVNSGAAAAFMARWDAAQYVLRAHYYEGDLRIANVPDEATRLNAVRASRAMYACGKRHNPDLEKGSGQSR